MAIFTFERYEKKFLLSRDQQERLVEKLLKRGLEYDDYCRDGKMYSIYNMYFDDDHNSVINNSLRSPKFKEKFRIRSYSIPKTGEETVYLEIKRKIKGIVVKRRAVLPYSAALDFVINGRRPESDNYSFNLMLNEISYYLSLRKLSPKVIISYDRIALFDKTDPSLRITFDSNILTRRYDIDLAKGAGGEPLLAEDERLMEVKIFHAIPKWLSDMLSEEKIYMSGFSKYGNEYSNLRGHGFNHLSARQASRQNIERKFDND